MAATSTPLTLQRWRQSYQTKLNRSCKPKINPNRQIPASSLKFSKLKFLTQKSLQQPTKTAKHRPTSNSNNTYSHSRSKGKSPKLSMWNSCTRVPLKDHLEMSTIVTWSKKHAPVHSTLIKLKPSWSRPDRNEMFCRFLWSTYRRSLMKNSLLFANSAMNYSSWEILS